MPLTAFNGRCLAQSPAIGIPRATSPAAPSFNGAAFVTPTTSTSFTTVKSVLNDGRRARRPESRGMPDSRLTGTLRSQTFHRAFVRRGRRGARGSNGSSSADFRFFPTLPDRAIRLRPSAARPRDEQAPGRGIAASRFAMRSTCSGSTNMSSRSVLSPGRPSRRTPAGRRRPSLSELRWQVAVSATSISANEALAEPIERRES